MTGAADNESREQSLVDPESAVKLRGDPPRVMRLSRKAIGLTSAAACALVGGALIYALQPEGQKGAEELYNTDGVAVADNLAGALFTDVFIVAGLGLGGWCEDRGRQFLGHFQASG